MHLNRETALAYSPPPLWHREPVDWLSDETGVNAIRSLRSSRGADWLARENVNAEMTSDPRLLFVALTGCEATTWTQLLKAAPDPKEVYAAKQNARHDARTRLNAEIEVRLDDLIADASLANEPYSWESLSDLRKFMSEISFSRRPAIYLLDNGNFRAVWRNAENEQAAFQFRGGGVVQCVFFGKRKAPHLPLSQETLVDILPKARARLNNFEHLLRG